MVPDAFAKSALNPYKVQQFCTIEHDHEEDEEHSEDDDRDLFDKIVGYLLGIKNDGHG